GPDVWLRAQPVDAGQRPEVHHDDVAAKLGGAERPGIEPPGCPAKRRQVQRLGHGHLAQYPEGRANFLGKEHRLLPGREVPAPVELVVVDEVGVSTLGPAARGLVDLAGKYAHAGRDGDVLGVEEAELVVPVEATRG